VISVRCGALVLLLGACSKAPPSSARPSLPAGVTYALEQTHYDITGSSAAELHQAMLAKGPRLNDWPLYALTEWEVRWRLSEDHVRGRCQRSATVRLTIRMVLPRWVQRETPSQLREDWQRFESALRTHELGHRDLGLQAARAVGRALRSGTSFSCGGATAADREAKAILDRYSLRNRQYDEDTAHGQTQGVIWPPLANGSMD
jgi:predicted secreted Zn-dependent protease